MAYRIDYGPTVKKNGTGRLFRLQMMTAVVLILFVFLVGQKWPEGTAKLREYLMPREELQELATQLEEGESVSEALTAFCRQMIANGQAD